MSHACVMVSENRQAPCPNAGTYPLGLGRYVCAQHYQSFSRGLQKLIEEGKAIVVEKKQAQQEEKLENQEKIFQKTEDWQRCKRVSEVVADVYGISVDCLYTGSRECAKARWVAFYVCREDLKLSYPQIGKIFHCDHSTVMLGCKSITEKPLWWEKVLADVRRLLSGEVASSCQHCGQALDAEAKAKRQVVDVLSEAAAAIERKIEAAGGRK